ncbi:MAG: GtrA family protein [Pseudomonadota bacterium]
MRREVLSQLWRFLTVGGVGFIVDGGLLWFFLSQGFTPSVARALAFPGTVFVTWVLNRNWTFANYNSGSRRGQLPRYFAVQIGGTLANYAVYLAVITVFGTSANAIFGAFVAGSIVGSTLNFVGVRAIAFRARGNRT